MPRSTTGKQIHVYFPHTFQSYYVYTNEMKATTLGTCILLTLTLCKHGVWAKVTNKEQGWRKSIKNPKRKIWNSQGLKTCLFHEMGGGIFIISSKIEVKSSLFCFNENDPFLANFKSMPCQNLQPCLAYGPHALLNLGPNRKYICSTIFELAQSRAINSKIPVTHLKFKLVRCSRQKCIFISALSYWLFHIACF